MPVTMKQITRELNHLEKVRALFPTDKVLAEQTVQVQITLAAALLATLKNEEQRVSNKEFNDVEIGAMIAREKVRGIKSIRERLNMQLGEAKQYFEDGAVRLGYARYDYRNNYKEFVWN